ncbi:hypothetical protein LZ32DRAFT_682863 [Colletotrichum eremochloae]|nr:hypothetical protein LZ32DRAFT_682863 [Colletotrichum eremochloae]
MVDRIDSYFPGRIIDRPQDDDGSTVYVSTDNGWTNDDRSVAGNPGPLTFAALAVTHSDSPNLIDFDSSDNGDIPTSNDLTEKIANDMDQESDHPGTGNTPKKAQSLDLGSCLQTHSESNLGPTSAGSSSTGSLSFARQRSSPPSSSPVSFVDALQSPCPSDDITKSPPANTKQLKHDHETLKRKNDRLDSINEDLKYTVFKSDATIEKLTAQLSEAELIRCRAQKYAAEISERSRLDQEFLQQLQEELDYNKAQLEGLKAKYNRVVQNQEPLQIRLQELQTGLLNAVERNKTYEAFIRAFVADNPQHTATFESIGIHSRGAPPHNCATGGIEEDLLISFDEISPPPPMASSAPPHSNLLDYAGCLLDLPSQAATEATFTSSYNPDCNKTNPQPPLQQLSRQLPEQSRLICANTSKQQGSHDVNADLLKWEENCNDIWESPFQRERALRNHHGTPGTHQYSQIPGMFLYGIRYVRNQNGQQLTDDDGIPDIACRIVIMTGLPDEVHIQRVLEHVRGGQILKAHTAPMGTGDFNYNHAYIEFTTAKDASTFCQYSSSREFGFITQNGVLAKVRISIPATDSYPLNKGVQASIDAGFTRCLSVTGFSVMHLKTILESAGLAHNFAEVITHFAYSHDESFEISFSSLKSAILVRASILESNLWASPVDGRAVTFRPDPCSAPPGDLQEPFLPTYQTADLSILAPENAQRFMTTEERESEEKLLQEQMLASCDPNDPDTVGIKEMLDRKSIVWEKTADWDSAIEYMTYDPDQRKEVLHRRDRQSGAIQVWYHGGWVMDQTQSWKAWEHYNVDSPHPYTQKSADLLYEVTGWVDRRKVNLYLKSKAEREENKKNGADNNVDRSSSTMAGFKGTPNSQ